MAIDLMHPCDYGQKIVLSEGIEVRFTDVGHLLGSSAIEIWLTEDDICKKIEELCPDATIALELMKNQSSVEWLLAEGLI